MLPTLFKCVYSSGLVWPLTLKRIWWSIITVIIYRSRIAARLSCTLWLDYLASQRFMGCKRQLMRHICKHIFQSKSHHIIPLLNPCLGRGALTTISHQRAPHRLEFGRGFAVCVLFLQEWRHFCPAYFWFIVYECYNVEIKHEAGHTEDARRVPPKALWLKARPKLSISLSVIKYKYTERK